jgi:hypothetical protein
MALRIPCATMLSLPLNRLSRMASAVSTAWRVSSTRFEHRVGEHDLLVVAGPVLYRLGHQLALVVDEEDDAVVGGEELEADREDLVQEALLVALEAHLTVELVGDPELLVVLAEAAASFSWSAGRNSVSSTAGWSELGQEGRGRLRRGEHRHARAAAAGQDVAGVEDERLFPSATSSPSLRRSSRTRRPFT